jgi:glycosyltransferase involved in cell wall biosynthesis
MKRRVTLITEIISPYRIPLFNVLAKHPAVDLHVVFLAETDPRLRQWNVYKNEIEFSYEVLPSWRRRVGKFNVLLNRGLAQALGRALPDAIVCGGYNYIASWQALGWARSRHIPFLLWSESNLQDLRREHRAVEFLKNEFLRRCSAFVVPGLAAREYLHAHGVKGEFIYTAPNAVDNVLFAAAAARARQDSDAACLNLNLPDRYFLFVGRLVREKGVFDLLAAYAKLEKDVRRGIGLVFAGDGEVRAELEEQARAVSPGVVRFAGFIHREHLAEYYALADAMILPTHTDTWGLVVNEAMACGLPVVVSTVAGCVADLVDEGWNGFFCVPSDAASLAVAMKKLADNPQLCATMGANSVKRISQYSPQAWADGLVCAVERAGAEHD